MSKPKNDSSREFIQKNWKIVTFSFALIIILAAIILFSAHDHSETVIESLGNAEFSVELSDSLKITSPGTYYLTGETSDGGITIATSGEVKLVLNGATIKNPSGPAIFVEEAKNVVIFTTFDTDNYLEDGKTYKDYAEDEIGAIFSHDDLILEGEGTLFIKSNNQDGIVSKDDLKINSGSYDIAAVDDAIRGKDSVEIESGNFNISAGGAGIKSTNETDEDKGDIIITDGTFNIKSTDDGIHSSRNVTIHGGEITIASGDDGIRADSEAVINNGNIEIVESYEGIEGDNITINGGEISVKSSDDGVNAAGGNDASGMVERPGFKQDRFPSADSANSSHAIHINGGNVTVDASGDGLDSNGNIYIDSGTYNNIWSRKQC